MKGQREYRTKQCPKCQEPIGLTWDTHYKCGWDGKPSEKQLGSGIDSSVSPPGAQTPVSQLFMKAKEIVADTFHISMEEMDEKVKSWTGLAQMIDSVFIELCRRDYSQSKERI